MKILLFGKTGQVGWELQRSLAPLGEVVSPSPAIDFRDAKSLAETIRQTSPDVIVNAAAYTSVDGAEDNTELCDAINARAPGVIAEEAKKLGAWFVHYSTDYVFDGSGENTYHETDRPGPLNAYGKSKLKGEALIHATGCRYLVFRTSWVYSARRSNFAKTILRLAQERDRLTIVSDQLGSPTGAELIADVTAHALRAVTAKAEHSETRDPRSGVYHLTAGGEASWHHYATFVVERAREAGLKLKVAADAIIPVASSDYPTRARRPRNSRLETTKLQNAFGVRLPHWQDALSRTLSEIFEEHS